MADDSTQDPLLSILQMGSQSAPAPAAGPAPVPDVSQLPVSSTGAPQPLQPQPQPQQQYQGSGTPRPILLDLIQGLVAPRQLPSQQGPGGVQGPPQFQSRTATFENFLGNFVNALGQGFQNEGRGPGAGFRGFGAAVTAPMRTQMEQQQFQTEQQQRQAQTQLTEQQLANLPEEQRARLAAMTAQPRFDPETKAYLGNMNDAQFQNYLKGQGAASTTARSKQAIAEFTALANQGKIAKVLPVQGGGYGGFDAKGNLVKVYEGAIDPAMLQKVSSTVDWKSDGAGGFMALPKTTVSGPAQSQLQQKVPGLGAPQAQPPASGFPKAGATSTTPGSVSGRVAYGKGPVFAMDPKTGQQVLSDPAEVAAKGYTNPVSVKQGDIEKEKSVTSQISDVQLNKSRYAEAASNYARVPLDRRAADEPLLNDLLNKAGVADFNVAIAKGGKVDIPIISSLTEGLSREMKSASYINLSDEGKNLYDGYLRTLSAVPAYQKALSNIGRSNKEMLDLELANIPSPTLDANSIQRKLQAFQENIDQVGNRTVRMPGIPTVQEVRAKYEPSSRQRVGFQIPKPF